MEAPVSLVTGSVRGLGLAVARRMRERGDRVHVVYRGSEDRARALEPEFGGRIHRADLLDPAQVDALVGRVVSNDGRLDHLVHAVGEYETGPLAELDPADFRRLFASNTESAFLVMNAARAHLRETGGSAVFFGNAGIEGLRAWRLAAAYSAAKTALLVLVRSFAAEEAPHGVRANMVSPGFIPHPDAVPETHDPELHRTIPMGRPGQPEELAEVVAWLCSPEAAYVTGANVDVAGGWRL